MTPASIDDIAWFGSALAFALASGLTPGPNNAMVTSSGATFGLRRTLPHIFGISIGFPVMVVAVALGAGKVLTAFPWIHEVLRYVGAAYMLWLAWHIATAKPVLEDAGNSKARPVTFLQAAVFQWVNPKAWVIAVGAVVTYTTAGQSLTTQIVVLALIFFCVTVPGTTFWTCVGVGAGQFLKTPRALKTFNLVMAALLVVSLIPLLTGE